MEILVWSILRVRLASRAKRGTGQEIVRSRDSRDLDKYRSTFFALRSLGKDVSKNGRQRSDTCHRIDWMTHDEPPIKRP